MGNQITISGAIRFSPPIKGFLSLGRYSIRFVAETAPLVTPPPDRVLASIGSNSPDKAREEEILQDVQAHVDLVLTLIPDAKFTGFLQCSDDYDDLWRIYVRDGQAVRVDPVISWPGEEEQ